MIRTVLRDLTFSDYAEGAGPLILAGAATFKAVRADAPFDRWMWLAAAAVMLTVCVVFLVWTVRRRRRDS